jgi:hypothetical protein
VSDLERWFFREIEKQHERKMKSEKRVKGSNQKKGIQNGNGNIHPFVIAIGKSAMNAKTKNAQRDSATKTSH